MLPTSSFDYGSIGKGAWLHGLIRPAGLIHIEAFSVFPEAWRSNIKPVSPDDLVSNGMAGQFYNRRGMLNATASRFLETGRLPFLRVETHCPFALVRQHLKNLGL